jgi:CheY-like chemotaxis protein
MQQLRRLERHEKFADLLVLDLNIPGMNGIDLLRQLHYVSHHWETAPKSKIFPM